jgi:hypothetical protein
MLKTAVPGADVESPLVPRTSERGQPRLCRVLDSRWGEENRTPCLRSYEPGTFHLMTPGQSRSVPFSEVSQHPNSSDKDRTGLPGD